MTKPTTIRLPEDVLSELGRRARDCSEVTRHAHHRRRRGVHPTSASSASRWRRCRAIDLYLGPKLLGKDPFDREQLLFDIDFPGNSCAKSGIDLALHDLLGKALGVPVCNLIGGSGRRQVLAVMEVAPGTADGMARQCAEWVE